ncbi:MAG TPA: putative LPS assembly protein LptD [Candidatus Eisenbacteria bacterium]|nr:putative LPS assembly protein LptD [Candidatus Eisenbacteria bacterium]
MRARLVWVVVLLLALASPTRAAPRRAASDQAVDIEADRLIGSRGPEGDIVLLEGNVVLRRGTTTVRSQEGRWNKTLRLVTLTGNVHATDGTLDLTADQASYEESTDRLTVAGNVHVTDKDLDAHSTDGAYDTETHVATMWGGVSGTEHGRKLRAARVTYEKDRRFATAEGDVWGADSSGNLILTAQHVEYDRDGQLARALGSPHLTRHDQGRTTVLTGDTLRLDTDQRIAWADGHVHIVRDTLNADAEHAIYWDKENRGLLTGNPVARTDEVTARGDTIHIWTRDNEIDRAVALGEARIDFTSADTASKGETNSLTASRIEVFFSKERADSLHATGEAENRYAAAPKPGKIPEDNVARGNTVNVYFAEDKVDRAVLLGNPSGEYHFERNLADSASNEERVTYSGDRIEYRLAQRKIHIDGKAQLGYRDLELAAGRVDFDSDKQTLIARDKPSLKERDEELAGRAMTYDLKAESGTVYHAVTQFNQGFYRGEAIHRLPDEILQVRDASYSTCDIDPPHYHVQASRMKIMLKDKIIARPIVFYIKQIPVFALPFYIFPIKPDRHSGFLFPQLQFGFSGQSGRFVRNAGYYWAPNDFMDFTLSGDYYEADPSWIGRGEARYKYLDKVQGQIDGRYTDSQAFLGSREYDLNFYHSQILGLRTNLSAEGHFTSSRDFTRDPRTGEPLANRIDRFLTSSVSLNRRFGWGSGNFSFVRRQDLDANPVNSPLPKLTQDLPSFSFSLYQRALGRAATKQRSGFLSGLASLYFNYNLRGVNHKETESVLTGGFDTTIVAGLPVPVPLTRDSTSSSLAFLGTGGLSDSRRILGFLSVAPNFGTTQVLYEKDALGQRWQPAAVYNVGISASTNFYGTFHTRLGPLVGFRHVIFPQVSFLYQPEFESLTYVDSLGVRHNRFQPVAGIAISGFKQRLMNYGLQQRFQVKYKHGDHLVSVPNLLSIQSNGTYDFLWREHGVPNPWRPLNTTARLQPPGYLSFSGTLLHSFDAKPYLKSVSFFTDLRLAGGGVTPEPVADLPLGGNEASQRPQLQASGPWSLSLAYSYAAGRNFFNQWTPSQTLNLFASGNVARGWRIEYYGSADLDHGGLVAQEYSITRDLHCWRAQFVRRFSATEAAEYYFRLSIVQQPELYVERGSRGLGSYSGY